MSAGAVDGCTGADGSVSRGRFWLDSLSCRRNLGWQAQAGCRNYHYQSPFLAFEKLPTTGGTMRIVRAAGGFQFRVVG